MLSFVVGGNTRNTDSFLDRIIHGDFYSRIDPIAQTGVEALRAATPRDSGLTADSWSYEIETTSSGCIVYWINTNVINGFSVAIGIQYGHGTGSGGYVPGYDYINPALKPIFDEMADAVWKEVQDS